MVPGVFLEEVAPEPEPKGKAHVQEAEDRQNHRQRHLCRK